MALNILELQEMFKCSTSCSTCKHKCPQMNRPDIKSLDKRRSTGHIMWDKMLSQIEGDICITHMTEEEGIKKGIFLNKKTITYILEGFCVLDKKITYDFVIRYNPIKKTGSMTILVNE